MFAKGEAPTVETGSYTKRYAMLIDLKAVAANPQAFQKCIAQCHATHNVPAIVDAKGQADLKREIKWIWLEKYGHVFPGQVHEYTEDALKNQLVPALCNHCDNPPCVRVCPTQATWKRDEDGIVMMDMHRCIGCRYCMAACPYGSRSFNWRDPRDLIDTDAQGNFHSEFPTRTRGVVEKCNFCAERLRDGLQPACVEAANQIPGGEGALKFGNLADSGSEVSQVLSSQRTITRRVALGTGPNVFYIV